MCVNYILSLNIYQISKKKSKSKSKHKNILHPNKLFIFHKINNNTDIRTPKIESSENPHTLFMWTRTSLILGKTRWDRKSSYARGIPERTGHKELLT